MISKSNTEDLSLRSEEVKDILTKVPSWLIRNGSLLFLMLFVLIIFLSWLIKYPDVIKAQAFLTTHIAVQKEFARISGKLDSVYIKDKQEVKKGQILAVLENTADNDDVITLKKLVNSAEINRQNVFFPFENIPILFLGEIEPFFADFENKYFQYILNKDIDPLSEKVVVNQRSKIELNKKLSNISFQKKISRKELNLKKTDLDRYENLFKKGIIALKEFENIQVEYLKSQKNYRSLINLESEVKESLLNLENKSKDTNFSKRQSEIELLKNVIQAFNKLRNSIKSWEIKYAYRSNINGTVLFLNNLNKGQKIEKGKLLFTIIPKLNDFYIAKLSTPLSNSAKIKLGQKVNISLFDYPEYEYGILTGDVINISSISNETDKYIIDVALPNELVTTFGNQIKFKNEMKGTGDIITEDLRLVERLFYQFKRAFDR